MDEQRAGRRADWTQLILPAVLVVGFVLLMNLPTGGEVGRIEADERGVLDNWLKLLVGYVAIGAEIAAGVVIGVAVVRAILTYAAGLFAGRAGGRETDTIRIGLGRALTLGLEFTVASDILRTVVAPTRADILNLGAIVLLRTLLNFFLEREIRDGEDARQSGDDAAPAREEGRASA